MKRPRVLRATPAKLYDHECSCGRKFRAGASAKLCPGCKATRVEERLRLAAIGAGPRENGHRWISAADQAMLRRAAGPDPAEPRIADENGAVVSCRRLAARYRKETDPALRGRR